MKNENKQFTTWKKFEVKNVEKIIGSDGGGDLPEPFGDGGGGSNDYPPRN